MLYPATNNETAETKEQFTVERDGAIVFNAKTKEATEIKLPLPAGTIAAVRLELLPRKEHGDGILMGKAKNDSAMVNLAASIVPGGRGKGRGFRFIAPKRTTRRNDTQTGMR